MPEGGDINNAGGQAIRAAGAALSFREVGDRFFLQYFQVGIPHLTHHSMQTATFFVAVLASLVEVQADAGQQGNRAVQ